MFTALVIGALLFYSAPKIAQMILERRDRKDAVKELFEQKLKNGYFDETINKTVRNLLNPMIEGELQKKLQELVKNKNDFSLSNNQKPAIKLAVDPTRHEPRPPKKRPGESPSPAHSLSAASTVNSRPDIFEKKKLEPSDVIKQFIAPINIENQLRSSAHEDIVVVQNHKRKQDSRKGTSIRKIR